MASRSLSDLAPTAREMCLKWLDACKKEANIDVLVYCTYRPDAEQNALYAVGRTVKGEDCTPKRPMGRRVTDARAGESFHQYRCAWDCVPLQGGKAAWNDKATYAKMAEIASRFGIEWAGNWKSMTEQAHFQYTGGLKLADFQNGKLLA